MNDQPPVTYGYWTRVALGADQWANTWFGGFPDETLSARAYRQRDARRWRWLYRALEAIAPGHCQRAIASERHHWQSPPGQR